MSAPPRVLARLRVAPDGPLRVVHAGRDAVYADLDGWCVGIVSAGAVQVPCALLTRLESLPTDPDVRVGAGVLHLDGAPLRVGRIRDAAVPHLDRARLGPLGSAVERLVGAGAGLTPYGDDVLCGWIAVHRAAAIATTEVDAEVRALLPRTTLLSATLLDCALRGEVLPELAAYVAALGTPDEHRRAAALAAIGHTSGAGLLEGARWALAA